MSDKRARKYFENMPYGNKAKSSEIHGKANQQVINNMIQGLVSKYDAAMREGDKGTAGKYDAVIKQIAKDLDNLKAIKEEFAVNYGGGTGGKNMFSNYTNLKEFDIPFWLEGGRITFDETLKPILSVPDSNNPGKEISKRIEDITENWVIKGSEEADFMQMQQDAVKQRNTIGKPLDFDVDFAVDNLLHNNDAWKVFVSDKIGGRYFLQDYLIENQEKIKSGEINDAMLHPDSFNPIMDTRLHKYFSTRIKKSFDPNYKQKSSFAPKQDETPVAHVKEVDLTKKDGLGPRAEKIDLHNEAAVITEGPEKIQKIRREGLTPDSQTFVNKDSAADMVDAMMKARLNKDLEKTSDKKE